MTGRTHEHTALGAFELDALLLSFEQEWLPLDRRARGNCGSDEEWEAVCEKAAALEELIVATPAATLDGVMVKLRLFMRMTRNSVRGHLFDIEQQEMDWHFVPAAAALRDLERLAGQVAS